MKDADMKKIGLGALVVVVILFGVYQYDPYLFTRLTAFEGFEDKKADDVAKKAGFADMAEAKKAGFADMAEVKKVADDTAKKAGFADMAEAKKAGFENMAEVKKAADKKEKFTEEKKKANVAAFQNPDEKKATPTKEAFADLSAYEGKADFGSAEAPAGCYPRDQLTPSELLPKDMNSIWAEQNPMGPGSLKGKNFLSAGALIGVNTVGQSLRNANLQVRSEPPNPQVSVSIFNQSTISPDISHRPLEIGS